MVTQDPRVTFNEEDIDDFFASIATNNNNLVAKIIAVEPSVIYARDDGGNTVLHMLISPHAADLETLNVVFEAAAAAGEVPDLTITNEIGADAMRMLAVLEGKEIHSDFWAALHPYMADYHSAIASAASEETDAYFNREETIEGQEATRRVDGEKASKGDGKCIVSCLFDQNLDNNPFNLDDQKRIAQYDYQVKDYLELPNFDFSPKAYLSTISRSDDLSIIMVPSALEGFSMEQITGFITQLSEYLFDNTDA
jgi:hypothetical protein